MPCAERLVAITSEVAEPEALATRRQVGTGHAAGLSAMAGSDANQAVALQKGDGLRVMLAAEPAKPVPVRRLGGAVCKGGGEADRRRGRAEAAAICLKLA